MAKKKLKYKGWSRKGRPFSPTEWEQAYMKRVFNSYGDYLEEWGSQYKSKRLRKSLISEPIKKR